jgi:diacylglycerol kinase family enzyme
VSSSEQSPGAPRRLAAIASIGLIAAAAVLAVIPVTRYPLGVLATLALMCVVVVAVWFALTRAGLRRTLAIAAGVVAFVGVFVNGLVTEGSQVASVVVLLAMIAAAVALGKYAMGDTVRALRQSKTPGTPVPPAAHGVLFMNLKSGGGKAERFHLVDECRRRGIEPVVLQPGEDWVQRVRDVASGGPDVVGMAGGDGSQAMVGAIAAELGLAMVVVPAGTRNHLALDLGLDRDDVVGALDAYGEAVERQMDLADVNGHVFVNNVSLGLYAAIVRSPEYRNAKVDTTLATLPTVLGPNTEPFDLRFAGPDGEEHRGAHVIQVSNNPYGSTSRGFGSRPRLDTGRLGVVTLVLGRGRDAAGFLAAAATGHPERFPGLVSWAAPRFEVTSGSTIDVGLDGETRGMDPPLRFSIRTPRLRVRLPTHAIGYSPAARALGWRDALRELWRVVRGRPPTLWAGTG